MYQVIISIVGLLIALGVLITVHEFGHFWVARRFGVKVLRFSIGFGKPFFRWHDKLGTEYVLASIPLGGYVALFGEKPGETIPPSELPMAFSSKPVWARILILLAGPAFNLIFAVLAYWLMFVLGVAVMVPLLGEVPKDSIAGRAGLHKGQEIVAVEHQPTPGWEDVGVVLISQLGDKKEVTLSARTEKNAEPKDYVLDLSAVDTGSFEGDWLKEIGLAPTEPAIIHRVFADQPADAVGLKEGDLIISVDKKPVSTRTEIIQYIQKHPETPIQLEVKRGEEILKFQVTPFVKTNEEGKRVGFIGVEFPSVQLRVQKYPVVAAFTKAVHKTWDYSLATLDILKKMILGKISPKNLSGPIGIAKYAGKSVQIGFEYFLGFLAMVSISLGVLNLLPIPLLDGGHIFFCLCEIVMGRKVPEPIQAVGVWLGAIILIGIMVFAFYNDLRQF